MVFRPGQEDPMPGALGGPGDPGRPRRLEWAKLFARAWQTDLLVCPSCRGQMRVIAFIEDRSVAAKILGYLRLPTRSPPRGRASWNGLDPPRVHEPPDEPDVYTVTADPPYID